MPSLEIRLIGDPILKQVATPILPQAFNKSLVKLAQDMLYTCKLTHGVGLAAPQVGHSIRLVVTTFKHPLVWANPEVLGVEDGGKLVGPEQCLSIPGKTVDVIRYRKIIVTYLDLTGRTAIEEVTGPLAIILQHEVDHLNGILITDYEDKANDQPTQDEQAVPCVSTSSVSGDAS